MTRRINPNDAYARAFKDGFTAVHSDVIYRKDMRTDTLYYEFDTNAWYYTTGEGGVHGYDTLEEAYAQTGLEPKVWVQEISEYWDKNGYRS